MRQKILCVEDDVVMQALVSESLREYLITMTSSLADAEKYLRSSQFDAVVMDILLPDGDGLKFWARICAEPQFTTMPILFLTGQNEISNKLLAFSMGAEDFISKPFDPLELQARLARRLKSKNDGENLVRRIGDVEIDLGRQKAVHVMNQSEKDLFLTAIELKILSLFSKRLDQVFSREQILSSVWGSSFVSDRTVDSHIAHLRGKIAETSIEVQTVKNLGYRLSLKTK